jgi:hypothetical protein
MDRWWKDIMTAYQYFEKHKDALTTLVSLDELEATLHTIIREMAYEVHADCVAADDDSDESVGLLMLAQNCKWNNFCRVFYVQTGFDVIGRDRFKEYWSERMPEFKKELGVKTT